MASNKEVSPLVDVNAAFKIVVVVDGNGLKRNMMMVDLSKLVGPDASPPDQQKIKAVLDEIRSVGEGRKPRFFGRKK